MYVCVGCVLGGGGAGMGGEAEVSTGRERERESQVCLSTTITAGCCANVGCIVLNCIWKEKHCCDLCVVMGHSVWLHQWRQSCLLSALLYQGSLHELFP